MAGSQTLYLDYGQWAGSHRTWDSTASFIEASATVSDGVHTIGSGGLPLDILLVNWAEHRTHSVIPVFFSAAIGSRDGRRGPFFSGPGMAKSGGYPAICIADPSLALSPELSLAWYAGSDQQATQSRISELLTGLAEQRQAELLLIGGSGGGFAALRFGAELGSRASVLVWNPQTNLLRYYRSAVRAYLRTCFPSTSWPDQGKLDRAAELLPPGTQSEVISSYARGSMPRRLVYLQSAADTFHVENHAIPFLSPLAVTTQDGQYYQGKSGGLLACFLDWGEGHEPPPKALLADLISSMSSPSTEIDDVRACLQKVSWGSRQRPGHPIRFEALAEPPRLTVQACAAGELLNVKASLTGLPPECAAPEFAFYVMSGQERLCTHWYDRSSIVSIPIGTEDRPTRIIAFARDSFGGKLQASCTVSAPTKSPEATRIFIFGSCVSRDAFLEPPPSLSLVRYLARSSLACALREKQASADVDLSGITSAWQRRMVRFDMERQLQRDLQAVRFDLLLLDLIDERFNVGLVSGEPVTLSGELLSAGLNTETIDVLTADDPTRERLWTEGVRRLVDLVGPQRIVVNRVYWATQSKTGEALPRGEQIAMANRRLEKFYDELLGAYPLRIIEYPPHLLVADPEHRWGISPFHYIPQMYDHTLASLELMAKEMSDR